MARLDPGMTFADRYEVERPLAEGGMGEVYVARDLRTGQRLALKLLNAEGCIDAEVRARFLAEARVTPGDESQHVVKVFDAGVAEGRPWIAMELLEGETLRARVARGGPLSWAEARHVFEQLCHGLGAAHARGIVHRDLKPENVFLQRPRSVRGGEDFVKVLDFGVAKVVDPRVARGSASIVVGTQGWWAPEQALGGAISPAADVWSLGLLAYWCLTGRPFLDAGIPSPAQLVAASARAGEQGVAGRVAPGFDAWFSQCVAWDPAQRFGDARVAWRALDVVLSRALQGGPPAPTRTPSLAHAPTQFAAQAPSAPAMAPTQHAPPSAPPGAHPTPSLPAWGVPAPPRAPSSPAPWGLAALVVAGAVLAVVAVLAAAPSAPRATAPAPPVTRPTSDRAFTDRPELAAWALRWYATVTGAVVTDPWSGAGVPPAGTVADYYASNAGFHSTQNPTLEGIERRWDERRRANRFVVRLASSTWLPQPSPTPRRCAGAGEVLLLALDAEEEGDSVVGGRAAFTCRRVAGPYLLSVRRDGDGWRICNESWHLVRALRTSCPGF